MRFSKHTFVVALALIVGAPVVSSSRLLADPWSEKQARLPDSQILAEVMASLNSDRFKDVAVSVKGGVVSLSGSVELYADKEDAQRKVQHNRNAAAVSNQVQVAGPQVSDAELQKKLVEKIQYDRVGYGTTAFNAISVSVHNRAVTLGGHAYGPTDKDSAISLATCEASRT